MGCSDSCAARKPVWPGSGATKSDVAPPSEREDTAERHGLELGQQSRDSGGEDAAGLGGADIGTGQRVAAPVERSDGEEIVVLGDQRRELLLPLLRRELDPPDLLRRQIQRPLRRLEAIGDPQPQAIGTLLRQLARAREQRGAARHRGDHQHQEGGDCRHREDQQDDGARELHEPVGLSPSTPSGKICFTILATDFKRKGFSR